jgi:hypothetical protein
MNVTRVGVFCLAGVVLLTGCSGVRKYIDKVNQENESYYGLQSFIRDQLTTRFHRSVRSVSCTPHVDQVLPGTSSNLRCLVRFTNGSSYTARATISDPSSDPDTAVNNYSFQDPPGVDITTAPLPAPTVTLSARGGVKRADIGRFVLTSGLPHGNAGWAIYLRTGARHFQALVLGQNLHALG